MIRLIYTVFFVVSFAANASITFQFSKERVKPTEEFLLTWNYATQEMGNYVNIYHYIDGSYEKVFTGPSQYSLQRIASQSFGVEKFKIEGCYFNSSSGNQDCSIDSTYAQIPIYDYKPQGVDIRVAEVGFNINWSDSGDTYLIEQRKQGENWQPLASTTESSYLVPINYNGSYQFRIKSCVNAQENICSSWSETNYHAFTLDIPDEFKLDSSQNVQAEITNELVEFTQGSYSVSHGRVHYQVPLALPSLPSGIKPDIKLNIQTHTYAISDDSELALMVCDGTNIIKTHAQEEGYNPDSSQNPSSNSNDDFSRICYKGKALVNSNPQQNSTHESYWAEGAIYYLPDNPQIKFVATGNDNSDAPHTGMKLMLPDGTKYFYGADHSTYQVEQYRVKEQEHEIWGLARIEDAYGNFINFYGGEGNPVYYGKLIYSNGYKVDLGDGQTGHINVYATDKLNTLENPIAMYVIVRDNEVHPEVKNRTGRTIKEVYQCGYEFEGSGLVCSEPILFDWHDDGQRLELVGNEKLGYTRFYYDPISEIGEIRKIFSGDNAKDINPSNSQGDIEFTWFSPKYDDESLEFEQRDFYGFSRVERINYLLGQKTVNTYTFSDKDNIPILTSKVSELIDGTKLYETTYKYSGYQLDYQLSTRQAIYQAGNSTTKISHKYDEYNFIIETLTEVGTGTDEDDNITGLVHTSKLDSQDRNYDEDNWRLGFVNTLVETDTQYPSLKQKSRTTAYIAETGTTDIAVTKIKDELGNVINQTELIRNDKGVITQTIETAINASNESESRIQTISVFDKFDNPLTISNAGNFSTEIDYDYRFNQPLSITDANGLQTQFSYNELGRQVGQINHLGVTKQTIRFFCQDESYSCPEGAVYGESVKTSHPFSNGIGEPTLIVYYNRHHKMVAKDFTQFGGQVARQSWSYYSNQQLHKQSNVYLVGNTPEWDEYTYDKFGRIWTIAKADGGHVQYEYSGINEAEFEVSVTTTVVSTDESGNNLQDTQVTKQMFNGMGQLIKSTDANDNYVNYGYDAHGNLVDTKINDKASTQISILYNNLGFRTQLTDPSLGQIDFEYTGFGELKKQIWAKDTSHEKYMHFYYDSLGRLYERHDVDADQQMEKHKWVYDGQLLGYLDHIRTGTSDSGTFSSDKHYQSFTYNALGQIVENKEVVPYEIDSTFQYYYDDFGRVAKEIYPGGFSIRRLYHESGYLTQVVEGDGEPQRIWHRGATDIDYQNRRIESLLLGNDVVSRAQFSAYGQIQQHTAGKYLGNNAHVGDELQLINYQFDTNGNLTERKFGQGLFAKKERFEYDKLNRLKSTRLYDRDTANGPYQLYQNVSYNYDLLGNLTYRSDKGVVSNSDNTAQNIWYNQTSGGSAYAVSHAFGNASETSVGLPAEPQKNYSYDVYGNMTNRNGQSIDYNVFNKPTNIGGQKFAYTANNKRYQKIDTDGTTTYYTTNKQYEAILNGPMQSYNNYVDGYFLKQHKIDYRFGLDEIKRFYNLKDHLGSTHVVTNEDGQIHHELSFNAWGERRISDLSEGSVDTYSLSSNRGFTGHEMLDNDNLIHMNGRVYDPEIGRFLSADPLIQAPIYTQSYNRYSYTWNNPLSMVDPSGFQTVSTNTDTPSNYCEVIPGVSTCYPSDFDTSSMDTETITTTGFRDYNRYRIRQQMAYDKYMAEKQEEENRQFWGMSIEEAHSIVATIGSSGRVTNKQSMAACVANKECRNAWRPKGKSSEQKTKKTIRFGLAFCSGHATTYCNVVSPVITIGANTTNALAPHPYVKIGAGTVAIANYGATQCFCDASDASTVSGGLAIRYPQLGVVDSAINATELIINLTSED
ncbi:hypothetical protein C2869_16885 [Saccharobesus litoralis]|uniref:Teneurin-like YD-shell domain-containing protein n=1 Tax=Saccharobesus litoralis TaxID=2172099 RepID=A0A2S0VUU4_9ALTE|nr:RHS repeat-associated core domain-containing protein [Saccharobesus litoralis]AWB67996.1 hypothetical protein C2869_16885 [Saccharobesus litoralis]